MPKVSVIIPVYKVEQYLERCVRSLFEQTLCDVEYIFIDDCSPDNSMNILSNLIKEYAPIIEQKNWALRIERMSANSGQASVRWYGVQTAIGDYIIHCDSDDYMDRSMLEEMWKVAVAENDDVVVCDYNYVRSQDVVCSKGMSCTNRDEFIYDLIELRSSWAVWNKLFKRSLFNHDLIPLKAGLNMGEDMLLTIQLLYYCRKIGYVAKPLYNYCAIPTSISNDRSESKMCDNYLQMCSNVSLLDVFFHSKKKDKRIHKGLAYLKFHEKFNFLWSVDFYDYYMVWTPLFPEIFLKILMSTDIPIKKKLSYYKHMLVGYILLAKDLFRN